METATMTPPGGIVNEKRRRAPQLPGTGPYGRAVRFSRRVPRPVLPGRAFCGAGTSGLPPHFARPVRSLIPCLAPSPKRLWCVGDRCLSARKLYPRRV